MLLKAADISYYDRMRSAAIFADYVHEELGLRMSAPVEMGACNGEKLAYALYGWVEGFDADLVIPKLHTPLQVRYGEEAGRLLRKIHSVKPPKDVFDSYPQRIKKAVERFKVCAVNFKGDKETVEFLERNADITACRPVCAVHGDFTTGSLVVDKSGGLGIIDFDGWDWGDPVRDFARVRFSCTKAFVKGQLRGYLGENIPTDFFKLMAYYTAADVISEIDRAYLSGGERLVRALKYGEEAARSYSGYGGTIPSWY